MINKICANIDKNHIYNCTSKTIGRQGENLCMQLEITLEECLCDSWVYLHFEKADGTTKVTERLEIVDNKVTYDIGNDLLDIDGDLKVFVELHKESGLVWRSSTKTYTVLNSFNGVDQIENKEDFLTEAQKTLDNMEELKEEVETGLTPTINENGNWEICGVDTGKTSIGPKGDAYEITEEDYKEIETNVKTDIQPILDEAKDNSETAISIAKGANQSLSYGNYETMITAFNNLPIDTYRVGQNILIVTLNVPDLWISAIEEESTPYSFVDDETFTNELKTNGIVKAGYYILSALETQKVDLTGYVKNTDYANSSRGGVVKITNKTDGIGIYGTGVIYLVEASELEIDNKQHKHHIISPNNLEYAVKSVVGGHVTLTQAEYNTLVSTGEVTTEDGATYTYDENTYYYIKEEE